MRIPKENKMCNLKCYAEDTPYLKLKIGSSSTE